MSRSLDKRLDRIESQQSKTASFDMLTVSDEPITRDTIENDTQKYVSVNSPFGMALKPVDEDHPRGMIRQEHLKAGNNISLVINEVEQ